jgi:two-component system OmpR family response regulator
VVEARLKGYKILVVDDEPNIAELIATVLNHDGYSAEISFSYIDALSKLKVNHYDLIVLDVMLGQQDGFVLCKRLRDAGVDTPIIFLTAKDSTEDKILGLKSGGDDYLTKPFSLEELLARIEAILRRFKPSEQIQRLEFHDLIMDLETHEVYRANKLVELTATEFSLLKYLMSHPRKALSKGQILEAVWGLEFDADPNLVETYISYLRKKIDFVEPYLIQTIRGVGYSLRIVRPKGEAF